MVFHRGHYYYARSLQGATAIGVARARRLQDIGAAEMKVVFRAPAGTRYGKRVWAPELQRLRGRWYLYFAAADPSGRQHRMYALQAADDDPQGAWEFKGPLAPATDRWAIDGAALELGGRLYFLWSGWPEAESGFPQVLYIAAMSDPLTIVGERHAIARPEHGWERATAPLIEAPQPLRHGGRTHVVYSAGASWSGDYALGLLSYAGGDPLQESSWVKQPRPLFATNPQARVWGPGHPTFVKSPDGREDWIVYHATSRRDAGWRQRSVRAQRFGWDAAGRPVFGDPLPLEQPIEEPSGTPGPGPGPGPARCRRSGGAPAGALSAACRPAA